MISTRPPASRLAPALLALLLVLLLHPEPAARAQEPAAEDAEVDALLARMTPEQKVGQLFLVAFVGPGAGPDSDIATLVGQDLIGGVVLLASNGNFFNDDETPWQVAELANTLQTLAMPGGRGLPLLVGIDHEGDGYRFTRITNGTTPLPNAMAIGATWDPELARAAGEVAGRELAAMGINLLLGPVVDVLNNPRSTGQGDIGTRSFGGDPWWVGLMGRASIEGIHEGSGGRVATVAKHFPGHGGSDRLPDEEVATVDKSLQELKRIELAPFFAVTRTDGSPEAVTDALMSSHIRYRGLEGDIRQFTAPISFDAEGMDEILSLEELAGWRQSGLMVSDSLGVPAVRRYFDPTGTTFPHRRIAKEAFLAGNDLLLLAQFDLRSDWADQYRNIRDTVAFFREEVRNNAAFAARVDQAVARILRLKLKLYPDLRLAEALVDPQAALQACGQGQSVTQQVAGRAVTLLYPDAGALPPAPRRGERILVVTDARTVRECGYERCAPLSVLAETAVQDAILRIFGAQGTGQVDPADLSGTTYSLLKAYLGDPQAYPELAGALEQADWILFAQLDLNPDRATASDALKLFLSSGLGASVRARIGVFSFNAPYYLDTTEISKLGLYLAAYSKLDPFVEAAVRVLFREAKPVGASPVDVEGIGYELSQQLAPDPGRAIPLRLLEPAAGGVLLPPVAIRLEAGPVLDRNGHPVPDGTGVTLYAEYSDGRSLLPVEASTERGMALAAFDLAEPGQVRFRAESGEALTSQPLGLTIRPLPTTTPSPTASATEEPRTATATPDAAVTPTPAGTAREVAPGSTAEASGAGWAGRGLALLAACSATLSVGLGAALLVLRKRPPRARLRTLLLAVIGGMAGYILWASGAVRPVEWGWLPTAAWAGPVCAAALAALGAGLGAGMVERTGAGKGSPITRP